MHSLLLSYDVFKISLRLVILILYKYYKIYSSGYNQYVLNIISGNDETVQKENSFSSLM